MQLRYSADEILADPPFARLNQFGEKRLHGGYDERGLRSGPGGSI